MRHKIIAGVRPSPIVIDLYQNGPYTERDHLRLIALGKATEDTHNRLGCIYLEQELYDAALAEFNKALLLKNDLSEAWNNAGLAYFHRGEPTEALAWIRKAISLDPEVVDYQMNEVAVYILQDRYSEAITTINNIQERFPEEKSVGKILPIIFRLWQAYQELELARLLEKSRQLIESSGYFPFTHQPEKHKLH